MRKVPGGIGLGPCFYFKRTAALDSPLVAGGKRVTLRSAQELHDDVLLTESVLDVMSELGNVFGGLEHLEARQCGLFQISRSRQSWTKHRRVRG